jgi:hypothetical protein
MEYNSDPVLSCLIEFAAISCVAKAGMWPENTSLYFFLLLFTAKTNNLLVKLSEMRTLLNCVFIVALVNAQCEKSKNRLIFQTFSCVPTARSSTKCNENESASKIYFFQSDCIRSCISGCECKVINCT